jgi:AraC-like DNA-binding protein
MQRARNNLVRAFFIPLLTQALTPFPIPSFPRRTARIGFASGCKFRILVPSFMRDYDRIAKAILYLRDHFKQQPALEEVARQVYVSPFHFQRLFKRWAGVSPKKFLQYISVQYAKELLNHNASVLDATYEAGFSGTGRLHDLFITLEGMTPGEYKNGGERLTIQYSFAESPFGDVIVASTGKGICHLSFVESEKRGREILRTRFPNASFRQKLDLLQQDPAPFERHCIPAEGLGNSSPDTAGQPCNLWLHRGSDPQTRRSAGSRIRHR